MTAIDRQQRSKFIAMTYKFTSFDLLSRVFDRLSDLIPTG
jgi:hypothetical protein